MTSTGYWQRRRQPQILRSFGLSTVSSAHGKGKKYLGGMRVSVHCTTLHCIALHCVASHCIALRYIAYIHTSIYT